MRRSSIWVGIINRSAEPSDMETVHIAEPTKDERHGAVEAWGRFEHAQAPVEANRPMRPQYLQIADHFVHVGGPPPRDSGTSLYSDQNEAKHKEIKEC